MSQLWSVPSWSANAAKAENSWCVVTPRRSAPSTDCSTSTRRSGEAVPSRWTRSSLKARRTPRPTPLTAPQPNPRSRSGSMTLKDVKKDPENLTMVVTAEFNAPVERVWQLWADPRQLERWWGPPTYPATVVDHDLAPGGTVNYFMTGPEGDKSHGYWRVIAVDAPHSLEVQDGFADDAGAPNPDLPTTTMRVVLSEQGGVTQVVTTSTFPNREAMEQLVNMGMEDGLRAAMAQMDEIVSA